MIDASYRQELPQQPGVLITFAHSVRYADAWTFQQQFHAERLTNRRLDTLLLLQHQPVYTLGRRTALSHLPGGEAVLRATGAAVESVNRGGSVTYHGPGQVVGYPILQLSRYASGPKEYVWLLEEVLRCTLTSWGIEGYRVAGRPGLFVGPLQETAKIASIGIRIDRGITLHGFALNVDLDLAPFSSIIPCGLAGCGATSIAASRKSSIPIGLVMRDVAKQFARLFNLTWESPSLQASPHYGRSDRALSDIGESGDERVADA